MPTLIGIKCKHGSVSKNSDRDFMSKTGGSRVSDIKRNGFEGFGH